MNKKYRIGASLLGFILLSTGAMVGCGGNGGGTTSDGEVKEVQIGVVSKGYGNEFAKALAEAYNKTQTGVKVVVKKTTPTATYQDTQLQLGKKKNKIDIFFTVTNTVFSTQSDATLYHWADLSDVYDSVAVGYAEADGVKTIEDLLDPSFVRDFTYSDDKQYSIPWTSGVVGLLYNKTKWDATNANLKSAGKEELTLPKTTDEMFALFDKIKTDDVKSASGNAYAFSYSGQNSYMHFMFNSLWPQYEGKTASENFFEGKNEQGVYTADIYNTKGREYAYDIIRSMILKSNGYVSDGDSTQTYDQEQLSFLRGNALFSCNGDWMEREASANFNPGDADVVLLRTPVMSEIVNNEKIAADFTGTDAEKDAKLSAIVSFIDGNYIDGESEPTEADATSLGVSLTTLEFIHHARLVRHTLPDFVAVIPEYSAELEEAKDFLKFVYSKAGQEIVMQETYGCGAPLTVDYSQMDYYQNGTYYTRSRLDLIKESIPYGNAMNFPMEYLGRIMACAELKIASAFGTTSPKSAATFMKEEYDDYKTTWDTKMELSGVRN
ncbi:MAG: extracellular solute-binding protein [Clostridia bacterium]|nr:extracellular solute-binding protein [Clostridia bacterium]